MTNRISKQRLPEMNRLPDIPAINFLFGLIASGSICVVWATDTNDTYMNLVWLSLVFATSISTVALSFGFDPTAKYTGKEFYSITKFVVYEIVYILTLVKYAPVYRRIIDKDHQDFAILWVGAGLTWLFTNAAIHVLAIYFTISESGSKRFSEIVAVMEGCSVLVSAIISIIMTVFWMHDCHYVVAFGPLIVLLLVTLIQLFSIGYCEFGGLFRLGLRLSFLRVLIWAIEESMRVSSIRDVSTVFQNGTHAMLSVQLDSYIESGSFHVDYVFSATLTDLDYGLYIVVSCWAILCLHRMELKYLYTSMRRTQIPSEFHYSLLN